MAYVGNKGECLKTLAKDTAATLAANKRVAEALRLAEDVNLFDVNHQDIKKRALEKARKIGADNKKMKLESQLVEA